MFFCSIITFPFICIKYMFAQVLIWDYNIPVPIKYISEPSMHSIPSTTLHPSGKCWVGQSLDNQVSELTPLL